VGSSGAGSSLQVLVEARAIVLESTPAGWSLHHLNAPSFTLIENIFENYHRVSLSENLGISS
jgi:hypothetical protein